MPSFFRKLSLSTTWPMLVAVIVLTGLGILTIWAFDPIAGKRQAIYFAIASVCLLAFQAIDYRIIGYYAGFFYVGSALMVLYTVVGSVIHVPGVTATKGACNWINFGSFSMEPSELMKVAFVMLLARYLRFRSNYRTLLGLIPPFLLAAFPMFLILKQPDLGMALIFIPALFAMLYAAGAKLRHLFAVMGLGLAIGPLVWVCGLPGVPVFQHVPGLIKPYQRDRVYAMFSTDPDTLETSGYQQQHSLMAIGSGGLLGKGIMQIPIGAHIPEGNNDMIYALIGEQFGLIGTLGVLIAYLTIFVISIEIAGSTREPFGRLVVIGIVTMLAAQTFINLMVVLRMLPVTGVTLPFVSSGGSSLIASFMSIGLLLNIGQRRPIVMGDKFFEFTE